jgi:urease subunit gamma/beta
MARMRLTAWEEERLLIFTAAELARRHRDRGLALNQPEAVALICDEMLEAARGGASYDEVASAGRAAVRADELIPGVAALVDEVRLEVLLGDGPRLVVLVEPFGPAAPDAPGAVDEAGGRRPPSPAPDLERRAMTVRNAGRRVVRVSSHYPFHLVNRSLEFDRDRARGFRLGLPSGSHERWAPGESREVSLVRLRGSTPEPAADA